MPFVYRSVSTLQETEKVGGGECARLVQHYLPQIGHTTMWVPGERLLDVLESGRKIEKGTAVATFVKGRYPTHGHRHTAFYEGEIKSCTYNPSLARGCSVMAVILMDQWNSQPGTRNPKVKVTRRRVERRGKMYSDGDFPYISDNAEALYIIEHRNTVKK